MNRTEHYDLLAKKHTAFPSFQSLLNAQGGYWPSLRVSDPEHGAELTELADHYDATMQRHGDHRRACRS